MTAWTVLITACVTMVTTLVGVFYGPAWKDRIDSRRAAQQRSAEIISRYSEPLAYAAFDLQSRLYNIRRGRFMWASDIPSQYRKLNTLWLIGQFLAWVEIVRRDIQIIDLGDLRKTTLLQRHLLNVSSIMSSTAKRVEGFPRIFRGEQRAIGELMATERRVGDQQRGDCLGYAQFTNRFLEPDFGMTFGDLAATLDGWMNAAPFPDVGGHRLVLVQRTLIDLIDFLDPDWVRFPNPDVRGKIPLPDTYQEISPPASRIAGFESRSDPVEILTDWATTQQHCHVREITETDLHNPSATAAYRAYLSSHRVSFGSRRLRRSTDLVMRKYHQSNLSGQSYWVELHFAPVGSSVNDGASPDQKGRTLPTPDLNRLNSLLRRFDRPAYPVGRLNISGSARGNSAAHFLTNQKPKLKGQR